MKQLLLTILTIVLLAGPTFGQVTDLGGPLSWKGKNLDNKDVVTQTMPGYNQATVDLEDSIRDAAKEGPWRFGYKYDTDFNLSNSGTWTYLPDGGRVWRLGLECPGAMTVNLIFENMHLPVGSSLYLFDEENTNRVGAYTHENNNSENTLGTELVHGEHIIVEYYEPATVIGQGQLTVANVIHGYRSLDRVQKNLAKALNSSGDCNIDVNCPLGAAWGNQIRSVAMIVVGGNGICTGALVNTVGCTYTPYFLTANHCYSGSVATWAFRFNWESPPGTESCATTAGSTDPGPPYDQTTNGGTVRAVYSGSDMLLVEINMNLTQAQNWNVFFAGWDNSETLPTQVTGIHHPSGDVKKICQDNTGMAFDTWNFNGDPNTRVWRVNDWEQGVTEPGSSGSPLFDQNGRVIGDLSGGSAACAGTNDNGGYDGYGRFGISWVGGGTNATRLSNWLDPGGTGAVTNDGCDPNAPSLADDARINAIITPSGNLCSTTFTPEVTLNNNGTNALTSVTINYDIDGGANQTFNWTGSLASGASINVTLPSMTTTLGVHVFNASTSLPNGVADSNPTNDASASNFSVGDQDVQVDINTDCWGSETTWTIEDASSNVITSGGAYTDVVGGTLETSNVCLVAGQCYNFIINDSYGDGMHGSQYGSCTVDGNYTVTQTSTSTVLATIQAANSDFGTQEINNFCVTSSVNANFTASPDPACVGQTVTFTDASTGATSWFWTFGAGATPPTATGVGPHAVTYGTPGTKNVSLTINGGADVSNQTVTVNALEDASFSYAGAAYCADATDPTPTITGVGGGTFSSAPAGLVFVSTSTGEIDLSASTPGTYTITYVTPGTCSNSSNVPVTINALPVAPTITPDAATTFCDGGSVNLTSSQATGNLWSTGATTQTINVTTSGSYTVTYTDGNGCSATSAATNVTVNPTPAAPTITPDGPTTFCAGGSVNLTSSQATGNLWSTGATTQTINVTTSGNYAVQYTDGNGCSATSAVTAVTVNSTPVIALGTVTDPATCGSSTGSIQVTGTGTGVVSWTGTASGSSGTVTLPYTITGLTAGSYTIDFNNGCPSNTLNQTLTDPSAPTPPTITPDGPLTFCDGGSVNLTSSQATGNVWSTGATTQTINVTTSGSYSVTYTDGSGCSATSATVVVTVNANPAAPTITPDASTTFCDGGSVNLTSSQATGNVWSTGATTQTINVTTSGSYTVTYTDGNGCSATSAATNVTVNPTPAAPTITPDGPTTFCAGGSVNLTSSQATGNLWSTGATTQTINVTTSGNYAVQYTDGNGCSATSAVTAVTVNSTPVIALGTVTDPATCGSSTGSIQVTGTGTGVVSWTGTASGSSGTVTLPYTITGLTAGSYTIDFNNGCPSNTLNQTLTDPSAPTPPTITPGGPTTFCVGGSVNLTSSQATGNVWSTGATTQTINVTTSGSYSVTYTDGSGCSATSATIVVTVNANPAAPTITPDASTTFCDGGSVNLTSSQATGNVWSTGATTQTINVTASGSYSVTYTDGNGCSATSVATSVTVNPTPAAPTITPDGPTTFCAGGSVNLTSSQASGNVWSTGATTQTINVTTSGSYTVTYTDGNGCSTTSTATTVTVNVAPAAPTISADGPLTFCDGGSVNLTSSQATGNLWSTGATTQTINVTTSGNYAVQYTDGNGCSAISAITVVTVNSNPAAPTITPDAATTFCDGGSVNLTSSQATGNVWSTGATTQVINVTTSGSYTVTYTDGNGCSATSAATTVTVNPAPAAPTVTADGPLTFCDGGSVNLTSSQATGNLWSTGATTQTINVTTSGNYAVQYTDGNGCSAISAITVVTVNSNPTAPTITPDASTTFCAGGSVNLTSSQATGNVWSTGATTQTINVTTSGSYTVTYTDGNGCSATSAATTVTVNPAPAAPTISADGPTTFCDGGSVNLTSSQAAGNLWSTGATTQTINVTTSGNYAVQYTDGNGCSVISAITVVTVNSNPVAPAVSADGPLTFCDGGSVNLTSSQTTGNLWSTGATTQAINVTTSGNYAVQYTDGNGCSAISTITVVTVNSNPVAPVVSADGPLIFCDGGSVNLTSSQATGNVWSTSAATQTINVTISGSYTVTYTDGNGCSATSTPTTITVNALPTVGLSVAEDTICSNAGSFVLTGTPSGGTYSGTGVSGNQFDPAVSGNGTFLLTYDYTDGNGCSNSATLTMVVEDCSSIDENTLTGISVYPNPVEDAINVELEGDFSYEIYDARGRLVAHGDGTNEETIEASDYQSGVYFLHVRNEIGHAVIRLVKD